MLQLADFEHIISCGSRISSKLQQNE